MLKNLCSDCRGLSPAISVQFTLKLCVTAQNREKTLKQLILRVQGHLRSSMLTFLQSSLPVLVMISSMSMPIRNRLHAIRANSSKISKF